MQRELEGSQATALQILEQAQAMILKQPSDEVPPKDKPTEDVQPTEKEVYFGECK